MKKNKRGIYLAILLCLIMLMFLTGYTFARYYKSIKGGTSIASIARWSFGSKNAETTINLSNEKIAPGSSGKFDVEVDATDSEVDVDYEILVSNEKNIPTNMKFYAETKDVSGKILNKTENYSSFAELAKENLKGTIPIVAGNQKINITIYWNWEFNDEDISFTDSNDATLSYDENGNSSLDCGFDIEIIGRQSKKIK